MRRSWDPKTPFELFFIYPLIMPIILFSLTVALVWINYGNKGLFSGRNRVFTMLGIFPSILFLFVFNDNQLVLNNKALLYGVPFTLQTVHTFSWYFSLKKIRS